MVGLWEAVDLCLLREGDDSPTPMTTFGTRETPFSDHVLLGSYLDDVRRIAEDDDDDLSIPDPEEATFENSRDAAGGRGSDGDGPDEGGEASDREGSEEEASGADQGRGGAEGEDASSPGRGRGGQSHHELFLPAGASPSTEPLKYEVDDDGSSDEDDDVPLRSHRTRAIDGGRGRVGDGRSASGAAACVSSDSSSDGSRPNKATRREAPSGVGGVSFAPWVTVHPILGTEAYPPSAVGRMYTGREELRANKRRNQREYAHDLHDWRNATEEDGMEANYEGELMHPASADAEDGGRATRHCADILAGEGGLSIGRGGASREEDKGFSPVVSLGALAFENL